MNMRLFIPTTALVVTSVLAVIGLMFAPMTDASAAGDPWIAGALILAMGALVAGIAVEFLTRRETVDAARGRTIEGREAAPTGLGSSHVRLDPGMTPAPLGTPGHIDQLRSDHPRGGQPQGDGTITDRAHNQLAQRQQLQRQLARSADTPLSPLRVFFTLRHTTVSDVMAIAFAGDSQGDPGHPRPAISRAQGVWPPASPAALYNTIPAESLKTQATMSREALTAWLARYSGFGEWPIKRPVEMTVGLHLQTPRPTEASRLVRFRRRFDGGGPVEVTNVHRFGDFLFQDNDVSGWQTINGNAQAWSVADLNGATLQVRVAYLSFDDINFQQPPRFHNLHLYFGEATPCVLHFTETQLASPIVSVDPAPMVHGAFFKTLVLEYNIELTAALLSTQLTRLTPAGIEAAGPDRPEPNAHGAGAGAGHSPSPRPSPSPSLDDTMVLDLTKRLQLAN